MAKLFAVGISAFLILIGSAEDQAFAGFGAHGAMYKDVENRPRLRDLFDQTTCKWVRGKKYKESLVYWPKLMKWLKGINWYLAVQVSNRANKLRICKTEGALREVPQEEQDGITVKMEGVKQLALRIENDVYLGNVGLDDRDQAWTLFHEIMHEYFDFKPGRMKKLVSFVQDLADEEADKTKPTEDERIDSWEFNGIKSPYDLTAFDAFADDLFIYLNDDSTLEEKRWAAFRAKDLFLQIIKPEPKKTWKEKPDYWVLQPNFLDFNEGAALIDGIYKEIYEKAKEGKNDEVHAMFKNGVDPHYNSFGSYYDVIPKSDVPEDKLKLHNFRWSRSLLKAAIEGKNQALFEELVSIDDFPITSQGESQLGNSLPTLFDLARGGTKAMLDFLIKKRPDLNFYQIKVGYHGQRSSIAAEAAMSGNAEAFEFFLLKQPGIKKDASDSLQAAIQAKKTEIIGIIARLVSEGKVLTNELPYLPWAIDLDDEKVIEAVVKIPTIGIDKSFIADPTAYQNISMTPLFYSLYTGKTKAAKALLQFAKPNVNFKIEKNRDIAFQTTLDLALNSKSKDVIDLILQREDLHLDEGHPLSVALATANFEVFEKIKDRVQIEENTKPEPSDRNRYPVQTPLQVAASVGYLKGVQWLLEKGADLNAQDQVFRTPLYLAIENNQYETARYLMSLPQTRFDLYAAGLNKYGRVEWIHSPLMKVLFNIKAESDQIDARNFALKMIADSRSTFNDEKENFALLSQTIRILFIEAAIAISEKMKENPGQYYINALQDDFKYYLDGQINEERKQELRQQFARLIEIWKSKPKKEDPRKKQRDH